MLFVVHYSIEQKIVKINQSRKKKAANIKVTELTEPEIYKKERQIHNVEEDVDTQEEIIEE